jgi:hypothetical protein
MWRYETRQKAEIMSKKRRADKQKEVEIVTTEPKLEIAPSPLLPQPKQPKINFDQWWLQKQNELKLRPQLKEAFRKHLEARGFMSTGDYDKGLEDFGIKA